ncbi:FadD32-like long-chain-fatty-acid--AMP ligase [Corynebacterium mendelii]|uniref:AMP-binding protein n=1 Tax=Corynebacterium mendelii TaxID=2765362 RepID=A0A939E402_9CORY|nr:FadD32-like long-chain-fatty-acid--AMP ligase [Corynebacterium mendelii]MBN9645256.1 AMP-binding protein [Corynebacterium mendelii]
MDTKAIVAHFTGPDGQLAIPEQLTIPAMAEMLTSMAVAAGAGDQTAVTGWDFSSDPDGVRDSYTRVQANRRIKAIGARLQQVAQPGDRAAILMGNCPHYVFSFLGAMYAGLIPVPLYDPNEPGHQAHLSAVAGDCEPSVILTNNRSAAAVRQRFAEVPAARRPRIISVESLPDSLADSWQSPDQTEAGRAVLEELAAAGVAPVDSPAFYQYTSGSTRTPAGVRLTHRSIITNALQIYKAVEFVDPARMVIWLPLHHDMGIVLSAVFTVLGHPVDIMSPTDFLQRPGRWISLLDRRHDNDHVYTASPNFALELTARYGHPAAGAHTPDLSAVEGLFIGSETITPQALDAFEDTFVPFGLNKGRLKPGYGLAEATLLVTVTQHDGGAAIHRVDRSALADGRLEPVGQDCGSAVSLISCGSVVVPQQLVIVDPDTRQELPDGRIGEMWVHGDNVAAGYLDREDDTRATFRNRLAGRLDDNSRAAGAPDDDRWMATGDLAGFIDGEIVITGRMKELIVIAGRNHYPADIEYTAQQATGHIAAGVVAAFGVPGESGEQLVVVAERDPDNDSAGDRAAAADIRAAVTAGHGVAPARVLIVDPGTIKRSSSNKIARRVNRAAYLDGYFTAP